MTDFDRRYEVGFSDAKAEAVLILRSLLWGGMPDREALEEAIEAIAGMVLPASGDK